MKKSKFTESQLMAILKEVEPGAKAGETCGQHGVSDTTQYKWLCLPPRRGKDWMTLATSTR